MSMRFEVGFGGHGNVLSTHKKTIEITRERHLTMRGDCIVGVGAQCGCAGLPEGLKAGLRRRDSRVRLLIRAGGMEFEVNGRGHEGLTLEHPDDIVARKSGFVCPRTLAVMCDKASDDMPRGMVRALQDPSSRGTLTIEVYGA